MTQKAKRKKGILGTAFVLVLWVLLFFNRGYLTIEEANGTEVVPYVRLILLTVLASAAIVAFFWDIRMRYAVVCWIGNIALTFLAIVLIEFLAGNSLSRLSTVAWFVNFFLIFAIWMFLSVAINSTFVAGTIIHTAVIALGVVNHYVLLFRGTVFLPSDIEGALTAADAASSYTITFDYATWVTLCIWLSDIFALHAFCCRFQRRKRLLVIATMCVLCEGVYLCNTDWQNSLNMRAKFWKQTAVSHRIGFLANFMESISHTIYLKPDGYTEEEAEEVLSSYEDKEVEVSETKATNIVVIMAESMADFRDICDISTNEEFLDNLDDIASSSYAKRGNVVSPVFGGGTSAVEFEFLTGCTLRFLGGETAPYQQVVTDCTDSLAKLLDKADYLTYALHAADPRNWNRQVAYPHLGFSSFLSLDSEEFADPIYVRNWVSDSTLLGEMNTLLEEESGTTFLFGVTVEDHGGYDLESYANTISITGTHHSYPEAEQYLSLLDDTDEAIGDFIDAIPDDEPTIVLIFGDHFPNVGDNSFYTEYCGYDEDLSDVALYATPYVFWANYDVDFSGIPDLLSVNFLGPYLLQAAGVELDSYNKYLYELSQAYPVVSKTCIYNSSGEAVDDSEDSEEYDTIHTYELLQYDRIKG